MRKIYISGKITGLSKTNYMDRFKRAEKKMIDEGYSVINPAKVNSQLPSDTTYEEYMQMSIMMLSMCDSIYMLNNWKDSAGARKEHQYAVNHEYRVIYEKESDNGKTKEKE